MNILDLPTELLEKIISVVPDQLTVGQTNRRFYQISCRVSRFKTAIGRRRHNAKLSVEDIDEDETLYRSIIHSDRKIHKIYLKCFDDPFHHDIIGKLLEKFKESVLDLTLSECWMMLTGFRMLSQLSNLQSLHLSDVSCSVVNVPRDFVINLSNLRTIDFYRCLPKVLEMFNHLPDNVLRKVSVSKLTADLDSVLFRNQREISEITWLTTNRYAIDTHKLKLTLLHLESAFPEPFAAFASLTSLMLYKYRTQHDIEIISSLHQLEILSFDYDRYVNLSSLAKLRKLQDLEISDDSRSFESLITLKSLSLINLDISASDMGEPEVARTMAQNCPNIRKLRYMWDMNSASFNAFLKGLTKLENFTTNLSDDYTFDHGLKPSSLQRLSLHRECKIGQLEPLLKSCVKLEKFLTYAEVDAEALRIILTARPNLKELCLEEFNLIDENFFNIFEAMGKNMEILHFEKYDLQYAEDEIRKQLKKIEEKLQHSALLKAVRAGIKCLC